MRLLRFAAALFALLVLAAPAQAQFISDLRTGNWIRVQTLAGEGAAGKLVLLDDERLQIRRAKRVEAFSLADVQRLEVSRGRQYDRGALIGAGVGLVGGVLLGALVSAGDTGGGGANMAVIGLPLFTIPGGMLIGALTAPHRYVDVARPYRP
ncbi:MAG TPA: hypothetical protein VF710_16755 [Longimicrobium sp.]|jgi:hypothetical protein